MKRRAHPIPAYKARLAQRRERLAERAYRESYAEASRLLIEFRLGLHQRPEIAPPLISRHTRATSLFARLITAATEATDRLAQDFAPKKGPGDARFFG